MGPPYWTAVATPELIGVLAWWGVVLSGPLFLLTRWRRRRLAKRQRDSTAADMDADATLTSLPAWRGEGDTPEPRDDGER